MSTGTVVIGYGNVLRGDDGVGPRVAEAIAARTLPGVRAEVAPQLVPELAELLAGASLAVFIDAWLGPPEGGVRVEIVVPDPRPPALGHLCDPGTLLALAEAIYGRCPAARMVRVPAVSFEVGGALSEAAACGVAEATEEVARLVTANRPWCRRELVP